MLSGLVITADFMTYDIKQKYCQAIGHVTTTQDQLRFTCQNLRTYFTGETLLKLKRIDATKNVRMDYTTPKTHISITGRKAYFEKRTIVFTDDPHVVITSHD